MYPQRKWCFVPDCTNTSVNSPNKAFVTVPQNDSRKKLWFQAVKRDLPKSKSHFYCCQDHFNFEEDVENYIRFKLMGGNIKMKPHVVPHIFECHKNKKRNETEPSTSMKRHKKLLVEDVTQGCTNKTVTVDKSGKLSTNITKDSVVKEKPITASTDYDERTIAASTDYNVYEPNIIINDSFGQLYPQTEGTAVIVCTGTEVIKQYRSVGVQVRPHFRSKYVTCSIGTG